MLLLLCSLITTRFRTSVSPLLASSGWAYIAILPSCPPPLWNLASTSANSHQLVKLTLNLGWYLLLSALFTAPDLVELRALFADSRSQTSTDPGSGKMGLLPRKSYHCTTLYLVLFYSWSRIVKEQNSYMKCPGLLG